MRRLLLIFVCAALPFSPSPSAGAVGAPPLQVFGPEAVGTDSTRTGLAQGRAGLLFSGGADLRCYDGENWSLLPVEIRGSISSLAFTSGPEGDRLWIGGDADFGWVADPESPHPRFFSLRKELLSSGAEFSPVTHVLMPADGTVCFVSERSVARWQPGPGRITVWPLPPGSRVASWIMGGELWGHQAGRAPWRLEADGPRSQPVSGLPPLVTILAGFEHPGGLWWLATNAGIYTGYSGHLNRLPSEASDLLGTGGCSAALSLPGGLIVFGGYFTGIFACDEQGRIVYRADRDRGLPSQNVTGLLMDAEGGLWASLDPGLCRLEWSPRARLLGTKQGFEGAPSALGVSGSTLLLATRDRLFQLTLEGEDEAAFQPVSGSFPLVTDLESWRGGLALAGSLMRGLRWWGSDRVELLHAQNGDATTLLSSAAHPGRLYFCDDNTVRWIEPQASADTPAPGIDLPDAPTSLAEDAHGRLWAGLRTHGAALLEPSGSRRSFPPPRIFSPAGEGGGRTVLLRQGSQMLAATDRGLYLHVPTTDQFIPAPGLEGYSVVRAARTSSDGQLWAVVIRDRGPLSGILLLGEIRPGPDGRWTHELVPAPGLDAIGTPQVLMEQPRPGAPPVLWAAGTGGVLRLDLAEPSQRPSPLPLVLRRVEAHGLSDEGLGQHLVLPHDRSGIRLHFAAVTHGREAVHYQSRLEPVETEPTAPTKLPQREFASLPPGEYQLVVEAFCADGRRSQPLHYGFVVSPPWYATGIAMVGFILGVIALIVLGVRLRIAAVHRRNAELEKLVGERTDELERANAAKRDFLASISHELRNPLNGVVGLSQALADADLLPSEREKARTLGKCAEHLRSMLEEVLDFTKIEAGLISLETAPCNLRRLSSDVCDILSPVFAEQERVLLLRMPADLPDWVLADGGKLRHILINYVANALKFAPQGPVELTLTARPAGNQRWTLHFQVKDNGPGLSAEDLVTVFRRFGRGSAARRSRASGTGLGLAVCHSYASAMGGRVWAENSEGGGACFFLELVVTEGAAPEGEVDPITASLSQGCRRALVVEDQHYNWLVMENLLSSFGCVADHAVDAAGAETLYQTNSYDAVFLDVELGTGSGPEVAQRLAAIRPVGKRPPFIATTAYTSQEVRQACRAAGMDGFLCKPIQRERLLEFLGRNQPAAAATAAVADHEASLSEDSVHTPPSAAAPEESSAADFRSLEFMAGTEANGLAKVLREFSSTLEEEMSRLLAALSSGDLPVARRQAHRLLSQSALVQAHGLTAALRQLQEAARCGDAEAAARARPEVEEEFSRLQQVILARTENR